MAPKAGTVDPDAAQRQLERLHAEVDRRAAELEREHRRRLRCSKGCHACCVDDLTVFDVEAERIRRAHEELLARGTAAPVGRCAFLDAEGACRIYESRPYVCRTQGLPLRWIETEREVQPVEMRDICPLNDLESEPLASLDAHSCWTLGPYEARLAGLQVGVGGRPPRRTRLRDLLAQGADRDAADR